MDLNFALTRVMLACACSFCWFPLGCARLERTQDAEVRQDSVMGQGQDSGVTLSPDAAASGQKGSAPVVDAGGDAEGDADPMPLDDLPPSPAGQPDAGGVNGDDGNASMTDQSPPDVAGSASGVDGGDGSASTMDEPPPDVAGSASGVDGGDGSASMMDEPPPDLTGSASASACTSYELSTQTTCGSYYCGVDEATLTLAVPDDAACAPNVPEGFATLCQGRLAAVVAQCGRMVRLANPNDSIPDWRAAVRDCMYEDEAIMRAFEPDCVGCFIEESLCVGTRCTAECLLGNGPDCERCRIDADCEHPFYTCSGLPNPL